MASLTDPELLCMPTLDKNSTTDELYAHFEHVETDDGDGLKRTRDGNRYYILHCKWCLAAKREAEDDARIIAIPEVTKRKRQVLHHLSKCRHYRKYYPMGPNGAPPAASDTSASTLGNNDVLQSTGSSTVVNFWVSALQRSVEGNEAEEEIAPEETTWDRVVPEEKRGSPQSPPHRLPIVVPLPDTNDSELQQASRWQVVCVLTK
jgi:hypothetical protein